MKAPALKLVNKRVASATPKALAYAASVCDKHTLAALCSIVAKECVPKSAKLTVARAIALQSSLAHLLDKSLTEQLIRANVARAIANWHFIYEGMTIPEWDGTKIDAHIVFIGIRNVRVSAGERAKFMAEVKLKTGLSAGIILCVVLYDAAIYRFLDRYSGTRSFDCPAEEISGMEARVIISLKGGQATIHQWDCTTAQREHNKKLAEFRTDVAKCRLQIPCNTCNKTILECPLAVWLPAQHKENNEERQEKENGK